MREGARVDMQFVLEKPLAPETALPAQSQVGREESRLNIFVVYTSPGPTREALRQAGDLAGRLAAGVTLLVPQLVPYPLPLSSPPVLVDFNARRFYLIASESKVETRVRIYLCRDRWVALGALLPSGSLVLIGARKRWWSTAERRLARRLRRRGHQVILVETE